MAESLEDGLLAITVDADDYAETAAGDTPSVPRTFQSEADFKFQKASYTAKIDIGDNYAQLVKAVPQLDPSDSQQEKVILSKKDFQRLGYAVGELYFDGRYDEVVALCARVRERCVIDEAKVGGSMDRWVQRCKDRKEKNVA